MVRPIAILTDFGLDDVYVGVMKGVIQRIAPAAQMIDLNHNVAPQNVQQAAFLLFTAYRYFPHDTVFLIVIDPGVGTQRHPVVVKANDYYFVAPDNGVLSYVLSMFEDFEAHLLEDANYQLPGASQTFHGRDIFAPAAAHLAAGVPAQALGSALGKLVELSMPHLDAKTDSIEGEVIHIDHFGNLITSIGTLKIDSQKRWVLQSVWGGERSEFDPGEIRVMIGGRTLSGIQSSYDHTNPGELLALVGSSSFLEIAVNQGSAAAELNVQVGTRVRLKTGE